jgi:hypothetical protein
MTEKDLVYDFLNKRLNLNKYNLRYGIRSDDFFNLDIDSAKSKLSKIDLKEQKEIVKIIENFNINQLSSVLENIRYNLEHQREFNNLLRDTRDIQKGRFLKRPRARVNPDTCINTYIGFMRALKENTLYTAKLKIDGKLKRVFIKSIIGNSKDLYLDSGFSRLAIDPETLNVYSFINHRNGRINEEKTKKVFSKIDLDRLALEYHNDRYAGIAKNSFLNFRKELLKKIDAVYGIERMIDTYIRMGGKINPEKYKNSEFKEQLIEHLEEKFGTDKLLRWAEKANTQEGSKKLKQEILETLAKKHGESYRKQFEREFKGFKAKKSLKNVFKARPKRPI